MRNKRILFCEDDHLLRKTLSNFLRLSGYQVREFATADELLDSPAEKIVPFDLLITDVEMPGKSGIQLAWEMQSRFPGSRLLVISGSTLPSGALDGLDARFLAKPFSIPTLLSFIKLSIRSVPAGNGNHVSVL